MCIEVVFTLYFIFPICHAPVLQWWSTNFVLYPPPPLPRSRPRRVNLRLIKIVENEGATRVCRKLLRLERPSHTDLNKVIAGSLACALMPSGGAGGGGGGGGGGDRLHIGEKLAHLCPNKDFVFLRTSMVPQASAHPRMLPARCSSFTRTNGPYQRTVSNQGPMKFS